MDSDEVRKRKEYAERKVKERHAALRKEAEEKRKHTVEHRERVQSVLKREQIALQKRMQQLNEDEERKKVTLAKQHEVSSRIAAITKSPKSFAFGSSTPRTLAYLDNLPKSEQQYDKKLRPLDQGPSQTTSPTSTTESCLNLRYVESNTTKMGRLSMTPQRAPPASHRPAPAMASMTTSMYVTSSAPSTRQAKSISKPAAVTTKKVGSMMTQSVYTPTSRPATSSRLTMKQPARGASTSAARPNTATPSSSNNRRSMDQRKPPMPRKLPFGKPEAARKSASPVAAQEPTAPVVVVAPVEAIPEVPAVQEEVLTVEEPAAPAREAVVEEAPEAVVEQEEITVAPEAVVAEEQQIAPEATPTVIEEHHNEVTVAPEAPEIQEPSEPATEPIPEPNEPKDEEIQRNEEMFHEDTSESHLESSTNTSLADELISIGIDQSQEILPSKPEILELHYPLVEEQNAVIAPVGAGEGSGVNDLIGVFGNDFINQNQPPPQQQQQQQRLVQFDEDTDSGKASPTSSETSSTTDEVTPRGAIEEEAAAEKITAPRVLPIVRSAEDIARKEKEIRESEERKSRLAAILAKSRGMASPMTNTLPPTADDIKESGRANDVLARVAAMTNSSSLQRILQRKQGSNPSLQTSESTGGEIY
ncbi:Ensconsin [Caenorhabditis elegans]|uniref:Ensconsin n=1 Tax=Caenorhabditis elegans TaxID=6239 RepID=H2KZB6_CAEEL|nr:Ensconsin [Caenorhabditis elegans]CCD67365.1 Ensconsin [Caenorhabditis elegans]|eukprot:NP_740824.1 Uncharacterized protein CELE_M01B12.4 [Caenorhabditis elegans]